MESAARPTDALLAVELFVLPASGDTEIGRFVETEDALASTKFCVSHLICSASQDAVGAFSGVAWIADAFG